MMKEMPYQTIPYYYNEAGEAALGTSTAQIFYSQCGEDLEIYVNFIHPFLDFYRKNKGFYVEIGAGDGVKYSNTKFYQEILDFTGILVEPAPNTFELLKKTRPGNLLYDCAITSSQSEVDFLIRDTHDDGFVSGIPDLMEEYIKMGMKFILSGSDLAFMMSAAKQRSEHLKKII